LGVNGLAGGIGSMVGQGVASKKKGFERLEDISLLEAAQDAALSAATGGLLHGAKLGVKARTKAKLNQGLKDAEGEFGDGMSRIRKSPKKPGEGKGPEKKGLEAERKNKQKNAKENAEREADNDKFDDKLRQSGVGVGSEVIDRINDDNPCP
jgi:hypothetical protein